MKGVVWMAVLGWMAGCAPSTRCYSDLECKSDEACDLISHVCKGRSRFDFAGPADMSLPPAADQSASADQGGGPAGDGFLGDGPAGDGPRG